MDPVITFYQTLAGMSFTLLGLWFGVLQFAGGSWRTDPAKHRWSLHIALHFFLPGMASLASMLAAGTSGSIWRITFVAVGLVGLVEAVSFLRTAVLPRPRSSRILCVLDPVLYALMGAVALAPKEAFGVPRLHLAGMAAGLVFLVGLCHVWLAFAERREEDRLPSEDAEASLP